MTIIYLSKKVPVFHWLIFCKKPSIKNPIYEKIISSYYNCLLFSLVDCDAKIQIFGHQVPAIKLAEWQKQSTQSKGHSLLINLNSVIQNEKD